jgi:DNA-binding phage protein
MEEIKNKVGRKDDFSIGEKHESIMGKKTYRDTREVFIKFDSIRRERRMSVVDIAKKLKLSRVTYYRNLNGWKSQPCVPKITTLQNFAKELGMEVSFVITELNDKT